MKKLTLLLFTVLTMCIVMPSCGPSEKEIREKIEKERQDSIRIATEKAEIERKAKEERIERERQEKIERDGFYTSMGGPYSMEKVTKIAYSDGFIQGQTDKGDGERMNYKGRGTEDYFKYHNWNLGVTDNDKAKEAYNKALESYKKGYIEGYNF